VLYRPQVVAVPVVVVLIAYTALVVGGQPASTTTGSCRCLVGPFMQARGRSELVVRNTIAGIGALGLALHPSGPLRWSMLAGLVAVAVGLAAHFLPRLRASNATAILSRSS
jgi:hypothetical protein